MASVGVVGWLAAGCSGTVVVEGQPGGGRPVPSTTSGGVDPTGGGSSTDPHPPAGPAFAAGQHWIGSYTCPQGLTELDLQIVATSGDHIDDAIFAFDWVAGGMTGSFHMSGQYQSATRSLALEDGAWIDYPGYGWWSVSMNGALDPSLTTYSGAITTPNCGSFSVTRQ